MHPFLLALPAMLSVPLNEWVNERAVFRQPVSPSQPRSGLPVANSTKSFWIDSPGANPLAKEGSTGKLTTDADICIIGAGITGISAAYHLSKLDSNLSVVVLEARDFCSGATGRNGGHLTPATFLEFSRRQREIGTEAAHTAYVLEHYTVNAIVDILEQNELGDKVDLVAGGHMELLLTEPELKEAEIDFAAAKEAGMDVSKVEWFTKEEMKQKYGTEYPAVKFPGYNLWPLKLVTELYLIAQRNNSRLALHTSTPVTAVKPLPGSHRRVELETPRGSIQCTTVLHAENAYTSHLLPNMHGPNGIIPTRGQVIATRAAVTLEKTTKVGWSGNEGFEYWFPRPIKDDPENPLVILGGGRESTRPKFEIYISDDSETNPVVGKALRGFLPGVFPTLYEQGKEPEMEWTGIMGFTKVGDPFVGPLSPGQFISAGYTGHGMPRAFACAEAVAQMMVAELNGKKWKRPAWFPEWYLTSKRLQM